MISPQKIDWRKILSWRRAPADRVFEVYWNGSANGHSNVRAIDFEDAYSKARGGDDYGFEEYDSGGVWDIWMIKDVETEEEQQFG